MIIKQETLAEKAYNNVEEIKKEINLSDKQSVVDNFYEDNYYGDFSESVIKEYNFKAIDNSVLTLNLKSDSNLSGASVKVVLNGKILCSKNWSLSNFNLSCFGILNESNNLKIYIDMQTNIVGNLSICLRGHIKLINETLPFITYNSAGSVYVMQSSKNGLSLQKFANLTTFISNQSFVNSKKFDCVLDSKIITINNLEKHIVLNKNEEGKLSVCLEDDSYAEHIVFANEFKDACLISINSSNYDYLIAVLLSNKVQIIYMKNLNEVDKIEDLSNISFKNIVALGSADVCGATSDICLWFKDSSNNIYLSLNTLSSSFTSFSFNSDLFQIDKGESINCYYIDNKIKLKIKKDCNFVNSYVVDIITNGGKKYLKKSSVSKHKNLDMAYIVSTSEIWLKNGRFYIDE